MKNILSVYLILCLGCNSNSAENPKNVVKNDPIIDTPKIEVPDIDTSLIQSLAVLNFLRETKKIVTDNRPEMQGLKLAFMVPSSWKELPSNNPATAYHFFSKTLNTDLQLAISPPSNDNDITDDVIVKLRKMFPGLISERKLKVAGKNAYEMINSRTLQIDNATSFVTNLTVVFFHNTQIVIMTFGNAKINEQETSNNISDLLIVYRNLVNTMEVLK